MLGLVIGLCYCGFQIMVNGTQAEVAVDSYLPFLLYWHVFWSCVFLIIPAFTALVSFGGMIAAIFSKERAVGAGVAAGGGILTVILLIAIAVKSAITVGSTYMMQQSVNYSETGEVLEFAQWNMPLLVIGGALYAIGCLYQLASRNSSSSSKSD